MGQRLIISEEEKRNIQEMYGLVNEQKYQRGDFTYSVVPIKTENGKKFRIYVQGGKFNQPTDAETAFGKTTYFKDYESRKSAEQKLKYAAWTVEDIIEQSKIPEFLLKQIEEFTKKGYVDITDEFNNGQHTLQIPDSEEYKADGGGYQFKIITSDNKDTGYLVLFKNGIRGMIEGPIKTAEDGLKVDLGKWTNMYNDGGRLLYNEKLNQVKVNR